MGEGQILSGRAKKLLALFAVGVVLLGAVVGSLWPASDPNTSPNPEAANNEDEPETTPEIEAESADEENDQLLTNNDQLLTETYGLELPVSVRAREIILETHELLIDFERAHEELREFSDSTRYSCQHLSDAFNPLGSGPGGGLTGILLRVIESDIGLEVRETSTESDNRIVIVGDLSDLPLGEITVITGMVQSLNDIANNSQDYNARLLECELIDDDPQSGAENDSNSARARDVSIITNGINRYIANNNSQPSSRADIAPLLEPMSNYSLDQINVAGSWDGSSLPADDDFSWDDGYTNPPDSQAAMGREGSHDNTVIIVGAQCDDQNQLPIEGVGRQAVIVYRLEGRGGTFCHDV